MEYEIMWDNLTKETQAEIIELATKNGCSDMYPGNYDIMPLATIFIDGGGDDEARVQDNPFVTELIRSAKCMLTAPIKGEE